MESFTSKPHVVFMPFPLSTHINSSLKLAKIIHQKGFHITFVITESDRETILSSIGSNAFDGLPDFRFQTLPIDVPPPNTHPVEFFPKLMSSIRNQFLPVFTALLHRLNDDLSSPKVSCIISDGVISQSVLVGQDFGIPVVMLWLVGASGFLSLFQQRDLVRRCIAAAKGTYKSAAEYINYIYTEFNEHILYGADPSYKIEEDLDTTIVDFLPGRKGISIRQFLNFLHNTVSSDFITESVVKDPERTSKASALIILTFEELEKIAIAKIRTMFPCSVYTIAPLPLLLKNQVKDEQVRKLVGDNIWKKNTESTEWLDSKPRESVIYLSFGSFAVTSNEHLVEFAWGLANSKQNFVWVVRFDDMVGLPQGFVEETSERGLILSWCEQEKVLNHPSIGAFLTHCGWNSVLESISAGVPMICWPYFGEHVSSCKNVCQEWEIGVELDENVQRNQVEKVVKDLIEGDIGKKLRNKAKMWMEIAHEAADTCGVSAQNIDKLVNEVLLAKT